MERGGSVLYTQEDEREKNDLLLAGEAHTSWLQAPEHQAGTHGRPVLWHQRNLGQEVRHTTQAGLRVAGLPL